MAASNLILIGMPGAGKSTVGVLAAKAVGLGFVDTDLLIQQWAGDSLQNLVDERGYEGFLALEEKMVCQLRVSDHVIATGGSVVYSPAAMAHLKAAGVVIYLKTPMETLEDRVSRASARGIAIKPEQTFAALYQERSALYGAYADQVVHCEGLLPDAVCEAVIQAWRYHRI